VRGSVLILASAGSYLKAIKNNFLSSTHARKELHGQIVLFVQILSLLRTQSTVRLMWPQANVKLTHLLAALAEMKVAGMFKLGYQKAAKTKTRLFAIISTSWLSVTRFLF